MDIAIIGAGNVGSGLATAASNAGHRVVISASSASSAQAAAREIGVDAASSNAEAVQGADVIVLAVPNGTVASIVAELGSALDGKVLVDATNPVNETYTDLTTSGTSAAELLQQQVPNARVVAAFKTVFASRYTDPTEGGEPLPVLVAGNDADAKSAVATLAQSLGFRPVDAGSLRYARSLEEIAFLNISLNAANGWTWQSHFALVGPTAA